MNALSAGVVAITQNKENIEEIKRLSLLVGSFYQGSIKIEINLDRQKDKAKFNVTEYDL